MSIGVDRRIAFVPEPVPGEALTSWIRAVSDDLGCGMVQAAQIIGYRSPMSVRQLHSLMWNVEDTVLDRVGTITGLGHQGIRAMGFGGYAMLLGGPPRGTGRSALAWVRAAGLLYGSSKFCPQGRIPVRWIGIQTMHECPPCLAPLEPFRLRWHRNSALPRLAARVLTEDEH